MTSDPAPKRSEVATVAEFGERRLIGVVLERLDEIKQRATDRDQSDD